jgi:hypothetical protein
MDPHRIERGMGGVERARERAIDDGRRGAASEAQGEVRKFLDAAVTVVAPL